MEDEEIRQEKLKRMESFANENSMTINELTESLSRCITTSKDGMEKFQSCSICMGKRDKNRVIGSDFCSECGTRLRNF